MWKSSELPIASVGMVVFPSGRQDRHPAGLCLGGSRQRSTIGEVILFRFARFAAILAVVLTGMIHANVAQGAIQTTLGAWEGNPIQDQDKIYTYIGRTNLGGDAPVTFAFEVLGGVDFHRVTLFEGNYSLTAGAYQLVYSIEVDPAEPQRYLDYVSLAVDGSNLGNVTVTKSVYDIDDNLLATLVNTVGTFQETALPLRQYLRIVEDFVLTATGQITTTTNVYSQTVVPEPATLAIWGSLSGFFGLFAARRRKRVA
jgi:hypothetical protein